MSKYIGSFHKYSVFFMVAERCSRELRTWNLNQSGCGETPETKLSVRHKAGFLSDEGMKVADGLKVSWTQSIRHIAGFLMAVTQNLNPQNSLWLLKERRPESKNRVWCAVVQCRRRTTFMRSSQEEQLLEDRHKLEGMSLSSGSSEGPRQNSKASSRKKHWKTTWRMTRMRRKKCWSR